SGAVGADEAPAILSFQGEVRSEMRGRLLATGRRAQIDRAALGALLLGDRFFPFRSRLGRKEFGQHGAAGAREVGLVLNKASQGAIAIRDRGLAKPESVVLAGGLGLPFVDRLLGLRRPNHAERESQSEDELFGHGPPQSRRTALFPESSCHGAGATVQQSRGWPRRYPASLCLRRPFAPRGRRPAWNRRP